MNIFPARPDFKPVCKLTTLNLFFMKTAFTRGRSALACRLLMSFVIALFHPAFLLSQTTTKYNVLFIAVDDMNERASVFGYPEVITPNLKRLASRGVVFRKAYC